MTDKRHLQNCPNCGNSWCAEEIPKKIREHYSPPYFFSKLISLYDRDLDCTTGWKCPFCNAVWERDKLPEVI